MNTLHDYSLTPEERLGPPKVDIIGFFLMLLLSLVIGLMVGIGIFLLSFLFLGNFTLQSGVSPILLSMITFFVLTFGNYAYVWWLGTIFPHIYSRSRTFFVQISVFSIFLYIAISLVSLFVSSLLPPSLSILPIYALHISINIFALVLLTGIIATYRYSLLFFYSSLLSFLLVGLIAFGVYMSFSASSNALFTLMFFAAIVFAVGTAIPFGIVTLYHRFYTISGYDPLGSVFAKIADEERQDEKNAESILLHTK